ncbi:thioredoxin domain-containing protein [Marinigracilibium pacificum]|uniref:Thioredoxin domain-containing protein n=1 Tax=Marinigracilibium pacificum TaxID=2729599 RepID=A0A848J4B5_9BACT|nr:thioredoxin domain-containing protein [Marinigracilibium pacificum]NMM50581.1 thioredoxin domain-containing protein [Marinigracilibium pacificum]
MSSEHTNSLIHESSPYLLQHAHNPVNWVPWGDSAFENAKKENKPLLISIGYSSCHWCHVMERESFEDKDIADMMNEWFVCVKVDREERPDVDQLYMEAIQAMGISGGWPLNVFVLPDGSPFYGGTYFRPDQWINVLKGLHNGFKTQYDDIKNAAESLKEALSVSLPKKLNLQQSDKIPSIEILNSGIEKLHSLFDNDNGGLKGAPKFPMPVIWRTLIAKNLIQEKTEERYAIINTLKGMAAGGIYDHIGGGFSRYSVDGEWFAPHFEKMAYDNGQLLSLYSEGQQLLENINFKHVIDETVEWIKTVLLSDEGGFYTATDADSEGIEGKYFTWTYNELKNELSDEELEFAKSNLGITENGNWEDGVNIIYQSKDNVFQNHSDSDIFKSIKSKLLNLRSLRIPPGLDNKILLNQNCLINSGLISAYLMYHDEAYYELALRNLHFIRENLLLSDKLIHCVGKDTEAFADGYALYIQLLIDHYQVSQEEHYLNEAAQYLRRALKNFYDSDEGFFSFSSEDHNSPVAQQFEIFDQVIPSSNSILAECMYKLGRYFDQNDWLDIARKMVSKVSKLVESDLRYMSNWGKLILHMNLPQVEVVVTGEESKDIIQKLQQPFNPFILYMSTENSSSSLPHFEGRLTDTTTKIYICSDRVCKTPVTNTEEAKIQLSTLFKNQLGQ